MSFNYYNLKQLLVEYNSLTDDMLNVEVKASPVNNIQLFGKIVGETSRPTNLYDSVSIEDSNCFAKIELFGFRLDRPLSSLIKTTEAFDNDDNFYMTKGEVITLIRRVDLTNKIVKLEGNLRFGTKVPSKAYLALLNYMPIKGVSKGKISWTIQPCKVELARPNILSNTTGVSATYLNQTILTGVLTYPSELDDMITEPVKDIVTKPASILNSFGAILDSAEQPAPSVIGYAPTRKQECRDTLKQPNQVYEILRDKLNDSDKVKQEFIKNLKSEYSIEAEVSDYVRFMFKSLSNNMTRNNSCLGGITGKTLIKRYLSNFEGYRDKYFGKYDMSDYVIQNFDRILPYILGDTVTLDVEDSTYIFCKTAFREYRLFYMGILGQIIGISFDDIVDMINTCNVFEIDIIKITTENPYLLQIFNNIPFKTIDKLGLLFNRAFVPEIQQYRNISLLNDYIMSGDNSNTLFTREDLCKANLGVKITQASYEKYRKNKTMFGVATTKAIKSYINDKAILMYPDGFLTFNRGYYSENISISNLNEIINDYIRLGMGIIKDNLITSTVLCNKELTVSDRLSALASKEYPYDEDEIDKYIEEYEALVGFKLEDRQRQAVKLLKHSAFIVTGGAGSGKTTVSNCIVYVLRKLEPDLDIEFAAPTGKAAKRMQEVVKQPVSTLHSKFRIGLDTDEVTEGSTSEATVAYFLDEGAMISLDLLYAVLMKIDVENCRLFLFGDVNQLPPIGKGLPFKNALNFMPCVYLNVSKRASEKSLITKNSNSIIESSDIKMEQGEDFYIVPCSDDYICHNIQLICKYLLGSSSDAEKQALKQTLRVDKLPYIDNLEADDIQVVSPVTTPKYTWGCTQLNPQLKKLFNPYAKPDNSFTYNNVTYSIGDRVIHTNKNCYNIQWYDSYDGGIYQKIWGKGICNGEVGKIVAIQKSCECEYLKQIDPKPADFKEKGIRNDDRTNDAYAYDVVVEYWDYISQQYFYIIYQGKLNTNEESNVGITLTGEDFNNLQLFYAGTTHKMQGSQAKAIICALGSFSMYGNFISKEMLYTMVTRASDLVILVGSVSNDFTSTFSKGRGISATNGIKTIGEEIYK